MLLPLFCFLFISKADAQVAVSGANSGNGSGYSTLGAAITAIGTSQAGANIVITITGNTSESGTVSIGAGTWTTLTIKPSGGAFTISGAVGGGALIDLNGADNVTIDGLNTGGNALTISNTSNVATSLTSTIRFLADATNNTITNCSVLGSSTTLLGSNGGNIYFAAGTTTGNDNNTISNCNLGPAGANLPTKLIHGNGTQTTATLCNSGIIINNNNFYDFFQGGINSAGVSVNSGCNTWSITNNRFYQTASRTFTGTFTNSPIFINGSTSPYGAQGFTITGNTIGYASNTQTGTYTLTGSTGKFIGIQFNGFTGGTVSNINSNTIAAVSLTGVTSSGTTTGSPFAAIMIVNGLVNTNSNTIGSQSATGSLVYSTNTTSNNDVYGVYNFSTDNWTANSNNIGGISFTNAGASGSHIFNALRANTGTGVSFTANNNNIGGTVANSIQLSVNGTGSEVIGIYTQNAAASFTGNTIRNLTTSAGTGTAGSAGALGIGVSATSASTAHTVSTNTIYNLTNSFAGAATVNGIFFGGPSLANVVERNFIYDLTASNASAIVNGIYTNNGTATFKNNMIRVGTSGGTATVGMAISGIFEIGGTNNLYHNSIYIGGAPTSGSANSFALQSSVTATRIYQNNIFFNARSNSGSTGKHYAISAGGTGTPATGLTSGYNDLYVTGTGGNIGLYNSVDRTLATWRTVTSQDASGQSFSSNPQYADPTGTTPDLHINPSVATSVEAGGVAVGSVTDDFDGQTRSGLGPVDIGADAGNFTGQDISAPNISYSAITTTCGFGDITLSNVTITDATGVPTSGTLRPKVYYRKGAGSWFSQSGTLSSGSGTNGTWSFTMLATDLGGLATGNTVSYYVIAQDGASPINIGSNPSTGLSATDVNTVGTPPTTPNSLTVKPSLAGTYTVGVGGNYTTLTAAIADYNAACLTGAVTFSLIDNTYGSETYPIAINYNSSASATFTLTIKPAATKTPVFSSTVNNAGGLIDLNGAKYVTIDGSNTVGGTTKNLTITNNETGSATIRLINDATDNVIKNAVIQGSSSNSASTGVIFFSTAASGTTGNDNNTVSNCDITNGASTPANGIYSSGTTSTTTLYNSGNTITGCNISNYFSNIVASNGIAMSLGTTDWTITNNKFFQTAQRTFTAALAHRGIYVNSNTAGNNFSITGNTIGFANSSGTGTYDLTTASSSFTFTGMYINAASTIATSIQGNTISGVSVNTASSGTTTSSPCSGIIIASGLVNIGNVTANNIGSLDGSTAINFTTSSTLSTSFYGILNFGSDITNISNNNIGKITTNAAGGSLVLYGIYVFTGTAQTATLNSNTIGSASAPLTNNATGTSARVLGISCTNTIVTFTNNNISYLTIAAANTTTGTSASVIGIMVDSSPNSPMTVSGNKIFALSNTNSSAAVIVSGISFYSGSQGCTFSGNFIHSLSVSNATAIINGIDLPSSSTSNATLSNNMIRLGIDASGTGVNVGCAINGVNETGGGHASNFYFNSIYIGGAPTGGSANTFALKSTVVTNTRKYQNNILFNARSNNGSTGKHYAIQLGGTGANPTGLTTNYNDLVANGSGGVLGFFNSADRADITAWRTATGQDANSFTSDPQYIAPTGNVTAVDLHIQVSPNPTPIEARGTNIAAITTDYDGQGRSGLTPEDIGADAGNFTQAPFTPNCPGTLAPTTATNQSTSVSLSWASVSGATGYDVYWSTNQTDVTNEAGAALISSNQAGTSYGTSGAVNNTYYWKVAARNASGASSSCTVMNYNTTLPSCPTLSSPANGATGLCPAAGNFTWTAPGSGITPTGYKLYLGTDGGGVTTPTNVVNGTNLGNVLTYPFSLLSANTTYYWQVVSVAAAGDATGCTIRSFTTGAAATIETQTPIADDFEYCSEWTIVNDAAHKWVVGSATNNGGTKSIYISNDNGATNTYINTNAQTSHFYRDVTFPAGQTNYSFTFDLKGSGEVGYDRVLVYIAPTSVTPVAGTPSSSTTTLSGATLIYTQGALNGSYAQVSVPLTSGQVGNASANSTMRIIFTWQNDNNGGSTPPAAIDNISITSSLPTPPNCATLSAPANAATNVCPATGNLTWAAPGSGTTPTGYKLYLGTDGGGVTAPTNVVNGTNLGTGLSYTYSSLSANTTYYWQIVPTAGAGDATGCSIRSFTTGTGIETQTPVTDDLETCQEWTFVNDGTNRWMIGSATNNGGSKSIYITNDGTSNFYTTGNSETSHFYRDVTFPAGETVYSFTFDLKGTGETNYDRLLVFVVPTSVNPVAGAPASQVVTISGNSPIYTQSGPIGSYTQIPITLTSAIVGNASVSSTRRIIFTWQNDGNGGTNPPAAIDNISITSSAPAPLAYSSSTVIQPVTSSVVANSQDNQVVGIKVTVSGSSGTLNANSITLNTQGTATIADIQNAKLWWTGASASFAATSQVGSTIGTPSGAMVFNFTQALATGDNYFWLSYDIKPGATSGRTIDAIGVTNGVTVGGTSYTPSTLDPSGSRQILVPLCGTTYTINNTLPTGGLNYNSFTDAINDLNTIGTSCAVVFNVKDGQTFSELPPAITATGTATKTITFQRDNSTGTRPTLQGTSGTSTSDAVIQINSGDYFTFDGINIKDNPANGNASAKMEYGVYLLGSTGNGCRHNTVKNSTITMNFVAASSNTNTRGVFINSAPTSTGGTCDYNAFYNNTVENAVNGYLFNNSTAIYDTLNQVGIISGGSSTIQNIGAGANVTAFGVGAEGQYNFKLSNTRINSVTSADLAFGFYNNTIRSSVTINGCKITNVNGNESDNIAAVRLSNTNSTLVAYDDTINTISNTLAAGGSAAHAFYLSSGKTKVYNCIIGGSSGTKISSLSGDASAFYIIGGASGVIDSVYNNTVNYIEGGSANTSNTGYGIRSTHNMSYFAGNNFSNITALYNAYGIAVSDISDIKIYDNTITTVTTSGTNNSAVGINTTSANNGTVKIYRNKVSGVSAGTAGTAATAYGIQVNPLNGTVTSEVVNNMVSNITANNANSGTTCSVAGIRFGPNGGASHVGKFYFNTVYLNGTGTSSTLQTGAFATNTNSNVGSIELISNIFYNNYNVNTGANAAAIWATGSSSTFAGKVTTPTNNNFLYAGTPGAKHNIFSGTTGSELISALSSYKTAMGGTKESASLTGTLNFVSVAAPYDLHMSPTTSSCAINGAGKAVSGITSDIDGNTRCDAGCSGSTVPDIGADEFDCLLVWTGNVSTAWDNVLNWSPNVLPDQTIDVLIPDVTAASNRFPVLVGTPSTFETKNLTINPVASVTLSFTTTAGVPQATLSVYGTLINNGVADMGYGSLTIKTGSSITGAITTGYLTIDGNVSLSSGAAVEVKRELTLKSGTFNATAGTLTLKSDANATGYVNDFGSNNGSLSGTIKLERYIPAGAVNDFHYIGSAIGGTAAIWADDFSNVATASDNTAVTPKPNCDPLSLASTSAYGNLFSYDQSLVTSCYLSGWRVRTAGATAARGSGFAAKINATTVLDESGAYNKTNVTLSNLSITATNAVSYSKGYHLVANPFFAPVDWNAMATLPANSNMDGTAYIYNPNTGTYGTYNLINNGTVPTNLGFFVRGLSGASFNVTFDASTRVAATNSNFLRQGQPYEYGLRIIADNGTHSDETLIAFDENFTDAYDNGYDAAKLLSSYGIPSLYTLDTSHDRRAIEALGINTEARSVPLGMLVPGAGGNYTFTFEGVQDFPSTVIIWLEDLQTGTVQYLRQDNTYSFTASEANDPDRFILHFSPELLLSSTGADCSGDNGGILLEQRGGIEWNFIVTDSTNNEVESNVFTATDTVDHLVPGTYTLALTHAASGYATTLTVDIDGLQAVTANILASATQVLENENITIEGQITGATNYTWTMGDGNTITGQDIINYSYAHEGTYEVVLFASNDDCDATTNVLITVSKQDTVNTGIGNIEEGKLTVYESDDVLFITQTISKKVANAKVTIYNSLGQTILQADVKQLPYQASYQIPIKAVAGIYYAQVELNSGESQTIKMMLGE